MEFVREIRSGGFGRVDHIRLPDGRDGARKTFSPKPGILTLQELEKVQKRFVREVRIQKGLPSNLFIPIWQADLESDPPSYVMPLADCSLWDELATLPDAERTSALANILDSLEHLHISGIVHRDLKPQNVLLHESRWKLSDFGFVLNRNDESAQLTTLSAWGTESYCAPEQHAQFSDVGAAADIYSFGCILHDMFGAGTHRVPYAKHTCRGPIGMIIEKCTEPSPSARFKTVDTLRQALFAILAPAPLEASSPEARTLAAMVKDIPALPDADFEQLRKFIREISHVDDGAPLFDALNANTLRALQARDVTTFEDLGRKLCEWAKQGDFGYEYCDMLVAKLEVLFVIGSLDLKAVAIAAAAHLGRTYNRYHVMDRVAEMCPPSLDETIARRVSIEILAEDAAVDFIRCAEVIGKDPLKTYHHAIATVLKPHISRVELE